MTAQVGKELAHELADQHEELIKPQAVNAEPLSPHGVHEHGEVQVCHLEREEGVWLVGCM
jgi:hypothetical protein